MKKEKIIQELLQTKDKYHSIQIPEELHTIVEHSVSITKKGEKRINYRRWIGIAIATAFICFTVGLNTSGAFASTIEDVPILRELSKVLTFRNYERSDKDKTIHVEIPQIQGTSKGGTEDLTSKINTEIKEIITKYEIDAEQRIAEYKQAFLNTKGTEEEFAQKGIKIDVSYEVQYETEEILSLILKANENWCNAYNIEYYYNINLAEDSYITLKDLLGDNYIEKANISIQKQMKERMEQDETLVYWNGENGINGFTTIDEDTNFYINEKGNPVIVFDKYEIAPGAFGKQEFEILP